MDKKGVESNSLLRIFNRKKMKSDNRRTKNYNFEIWSRLPLCFTSSTSASFHCLEQTEHYTSSSCK